MILLATDRRGVEIAERDATTGTWNVRGTLTDVPVTCLAVQPAVPGRLYAGTRDRGVLRSDDIGSTWHAAGMAGTCVMSLAVSAAAPDTVYAGGKPAAVFASDDAGATWRELEGFRRTRRWYWLSPAEPPDWRAYVQGLAASPTDPDVVVAGIEAGAVVRSTDGGRNWSAHRRVADRDCHALAFHTTDGRWVYEAGGGGPAVSRDGGDRWTHPLTGLRGRYGMAVAADPERPEVWYVTTAPMGGLATLWRGPTGHRDGAAQAAVYRASGGGGWTALAGGLPQPLQHPPYGLVTHRGAPGHVTLGLAHGELWHSADHGDHWERLPVRFGGIRRTLIAA
jgi:hypothetical protein